MYTFLIIDFEGILYLINYSASICCSSHLRDTMTNVDSTLASKDKVKFKMLHFQKCFKRGSRVEVILKPNKEENGKYSSSSLEAFVHRCF